MSLGLAVLGCCGLLAACGSDPEPPATTGKDASTQNTAGKDTATADLQAGGDANIPDGGSVTVPTDAAGPWAEQCASGPNVCDDGNPCTVDGCDPVSGCTATVKGCADSDPCTVDSCSVATGDCTHAPEDCEDGNACTAGTCKAGEGCTFTATDCNDGDNCTSDGCTPTTGCQHAQLNCNDGKTCTADSCDPAKGCVNVAPTGQKCCEIAADCEDGNVCTAHTCLAGICATQAVFGCCAAAKDCDDGNNCTQDSCNAGTGTCSNAPLSGAGCCQADLDCDDGKPCTQDKCQANTCSHEPTCCTQDAECAAVVAGAGACAVAACKSGSCAASPTLDPTTQVASAACCQPSVAGAAFEGADTWKATLVPSKGGAWAITQGAGNPGSGLRFMASPQPNPGAGSVAQARMAKVALPLGLESTLKFHYKGSLGPGDQLRLRAVTDAGNWLIWQGGNSSGWASLSIDLTGFGSRAGTRNLQLVFEMTMVTGPAAGWTLDNLSISSTCKARTCTSAAGCNDGIGATLDACLGGQCSYGPSKDYCEFNNTPCDDKNLCTTDYCSNFQCMHNKITNCCVGQADCEDKNPCTDDFCNASSQCQHLTKPGDICCNTAADCDDKKVCTQDLCPTAGLPCQHTTTVANCCDSVADCNDKDDCTLDTCGKNQCSHKQYCCASDKDCDDGDPVCTADTCVAGKCTWTKLVKPECCSPVMIQADFELGLPTDLVLSGSSTKVKWQPVVGKKTHSGTGSLYYGDPAVNNFDVPGQKSDGTISWAQPLSLPSNDTYELSFWLWMDTESGGFDTISVTVAEQGAPAKELWNKAQVNPPVQMQAWQQIKIDLTAFAGKTVAISIKFDTIDSIANTMEGVYLDDLQLTRTCK